MISAGHASVPQASSGLVPAEFSTASEKPSPSESALGAGVAVAVAVGVAVTERVAVAVSVAVAVAVAVGVGVAPVSGKPGTQAGPLVAVPLMLLPDESAIEVPVPSFIPQRPISPDAVATSVSFAD